MSTYPTIVAHQYSRQRLVVVLALASLIVLSHPLSAAERGLSHYLAGYYGDFAVAVAPQPNTYVYSTYYHYDATSKGPDLTKGASAKASASINGFLIAPDVSFVGAKYAFGGYIAYVDASLDLTVSTPFGPLNFHDEDRGISDASISPMSLYWSSGNWHWNLYSAVFLPSGAFDQKSPLNIGRNYFSFDTVLAMTWLDPNIGLEVSIVPGVMFNTKNNDTGYTTGAELHIDAMVNVFLSKNFAFGIHGYLYEQLEADSGRGTIGANVKSSSAAFGPAVFISMADVGANAKIVGKWLHEFSAENRFEGDILSLTAMVAF